MRQLAIIKNVGIGMRDCSSPVLWFDVYAEEHCAALQVFDWDRARDIIQAAGVEDVSSLEGRPCWVQHEGNKMTFEDVWHD